MAVYTLFSQGTTGATLTADSADYTMGVQFSVSQAATLTAIWFYSASGAGALPDTIALYDVSSTSLITSQAASWSGAAGSGWVRAAFTSPPSLTASTAYKAAVGEFSGNFFYAGVSHYWDTTGAGASGISNGPLSAPNNAGASGGQDTFTSGTSLAYPSSSFGAANYWVDPEITTAATPVSLADSATSADSVTCGAAVPQADSGGCAEAVTVTSAAATADTGTGSENISAAVAAAYADSGAASELVTAGVTLGEAGAGTDAVVPAVALALAEAAAGPDAASVSAAVSFAETASGDGDLSAADAASLADAGNAADALTAAAAVPGADTGASADTLAVAFAIGAAETGTGTDAGTAAVAAAVPDAGGCADSLSVTTALGLDEAGACADTLALPVPVTLADGDGAFGDDSGFTAGMVFPDTGTATEALGPGRVVSDTGSGDDSGLTLTVAAAVADAGAADDRPWEFPATGTAVFPYYADLPDAALARVRAGDEFLWYAAS